MERVDFAVIGGGIAGASAAYELAAHGEVVLLEAEDTLGYHTTGRSAAMFTEAYEAGPVRRLAMASRSFLENPSEGFATDPLLAPLPIMFIGRTDQEAAIGSLAQDLAALGPQVEVLARAAMLELCSVLNGDYVSTGLLEPSAQEIDVDALHQGYVRGARDRGVTVLQGSAVTDLEPRRSKWIVTAGDTRLKADAVINATGAWCDEIAAMAGAALIDLTPLRRTAFTFPAPRGVRPQSLPFVVDVDERFYFKPEGDGFLGSPADETPMSAHDVRHQESDVALAIERINRATTLGITHVRSAWAGLRSFVRDRKPVVGEDPDRSGFFWLAGQGGFGIMTAPALARALTGLVVRGRLPDDLLEAGMDPEEIGPGRLRRLRI